MKLSKLVLALSAALLIAGSGAASAQMRAPLRAGSVALEAGTKTATASAGAATLSKSAGVITTESLSTAQNATYTLTLTNSRIAAADQVFASVSMGTATTGNPTITTVRPQAGSVVIVL